MSHTKKERGASKIKLKNANKKRTVTVRSVINGNLELLKGFGINFFVISPSDIFKCILENY
jgi:hypothetical protein